MKIIAITTFNDGIALVLDRPLAYKYNRYGETIIGQDGIFYRSYGYAYDRYAKAFAGRKFTLQMEDGETVNCNGKWWDGITDITRQKIGSDIVSVTVCDKESLKHCYVFFSGYANKEQLDAFIKTYTGKKYGYWEYESILRKTRLLRDDRCDFRKRKNHKRFNRIIYK